MNLSIFFKKDRKTIRRFFSRLLFRTGYENVVILLENG